MLHVQQMMFGSSRLIRPIFKSQQAPKSKLFLKFISCHKCNVLRSSPMKRAKTTVTTNNGYNGYRRTLCWSTSGTLAFCKRLTIEKATCSVQANKSTTAKVLNEEINGLIDESMEAIPFPEQLAEQMSDAKCQENGPDVEEKNDKAADKKRRKKTKNPLPAQTLDGRQLTFIEESKVIAEMDALIKHERSVEAFQLFNKHRRKGHKFKVDAYNQLLHGIASCGNWLQIDLLLHSMKSQGVEPTFQTYAALIEACWKLEENDKLELIISQMESDGFPAVNIFHKCILTSSQVDAVMAALKSIDPSYQPIAPYIPSRLQLPGIPLLKGLKRPVEKQIESVSVLPDLSAEELGSLLEKQMDIEITGHLIVPSIEKKKKVTNKELKRKELYMKICEEWQAALTERIKKEIEEGTLDKDVKYSSGKSLQHKYIPYLSLIEPEQLSNLVINDVLPILCSQPHGVSVNYICRQLGGLIHARYALKCKQEAGVIDKVKEIYKKYVDYATSPSELSKILPREKWYYLEQQSESLASLKTNAPIWPYTVKVLVAGVLIDMLIRTAKVNTEIFNARTPEIVPVLSHGYGSYEGRRFGILKMHAAVARIYKSYLTNQGDIAMEAEKVPMLVPPRPWSSVNEGGYLVHPVPFVRTIMDRYQLGQMQDRDEAGKLNAIYDSLNFLGTTSWKINQKILDIMIGIFNDKGDKNLEIFGPEFPPVPKIKTSNEMTEEDLRAMVRERRLIKKLNNEVFALRMDLLYKLSVANHLREKVFWLPSNIDFRGRVYPIPPHCCHMGNLTRRLNYLRHNRGYFIMDQTNSSKTFLGNKLGQRDIQFTVSVRKAEVRNCNESKNMKKNIDQYYKEHQQVLKDLEKEQTNLMNRWKLRRMSLVAVNNARQEEVIAAVESSNNDPVTTATITTTTTTTVATTSETWNAKFADQKHNTTDTKSPLPNIEKNWRKLNLSRMTARSEPFSGPLPEVQATSPRHKQNNIFGKLFQNSPEKRKRFSDHGTDKWAKNEDATGQKTKTGDVTDKQSGKDDVSNNGSPREDSTGKWPKSLLPHLSRNLSLGCVGDNRLNTLPRSKLQQKRFSHSISYESGLDKSWGKSLNAKDGLLKAALLQANNAVNVLPKSPLLSPRQSKLKRHSDVRVDVIPEI